MKYKPPIDIHEAVVERTYGRTGDGEIIADEHIAAVAAVARTTRVNCETLAALADALQADATQTPEARALKLRESALKLAEATARKLDSAKSKLSKEISLIELRTGTPPPAKDSVDLGLEAEMRSRLATMNDKTRDEAINAAFLSGDRLVVGAVLRGPAMLTGMGQLRQDMIRHRYRSTFHAEEYARRQRLAKALEATERCGNSFVGFVAPMTSGQAVLLAESAANNARIAEQAAIAAAAE